MAVDQLHPPRPSKRPDDATLVQYDQYIDTQIGRTRRMTKVVDIAVAMIWLAIGAIAFLLAVALAEHWLVPGGFGTLGRFVLFSILALWAGYIVYRRLAPLCLRPINPVYAAQTIEKSSPSLKNSLLNLLLFRRHRSDIPEAVYQTLEEQAAERLTHIPVDSAVDRTHLIRLGYVLLAVFILGALYTMFSPKSPLTAARRVLIPWADIPPASRVSIADVQPGSASVSRGELVDVSAAVRGTDDDDAVLLRYTTDDRQAVGKALPMTPTASGRRFQGRLPEDPRPGGVVGVARDLRYWIEAGDARSREFVITVVTAPTIVVQRVDYDYPDYTGFADQSVEGLGDIRAIEGTRVTIHAQANGRIAESYLDFEADGRRDIAMKTDGTKAQADFTLTLRNDRYTPQYTSYVVRLTNSAGRKNREPVQHPIDVLPDYRPEIELLAPQEKVRDVHLNETVTVEVEARDPDFELGEVRLQGEVAGRNVIDVPLLAEEHQGRFTGRYQLTPSQHSLRAGDTVHYWAKASDNRTPEPNVTITESQTLRITSPDPRHQPPAAEEQQHDRDQQRDQGGEEQQSDRDGESQDGQGTARDEQSTDRGGEQNQDQPGGLGDGQRSERPSDGSQQNGEGGQSNGRPDASDQGAESKDAGGDDSARAERQPSSGDGRLNGQRRPGAASRPGDRRQGAEPTEDQSPVSPEGDDDGEAFERIGRFLRQRGQLEDREQGNRRPPERGEGPGAETMPGEPDQQREQPSETSEQSESPGGQQTSSKGPSGAGDQPGEEQGAPDSEPGMKPADKWQQRPSDGPQNDDQEPPSAGKGKRESDSQGEQGGDMAGGGQEGGGQDAPREGTGSAGQNQSADEGMGESSERGAGRTSPDAGQDATAPNQTGQTGDQQPGQGSQNREGQGKETRGRPGGEDAPARSEERQPSDQRGEENADKPSSRDAQHGERRDDELFGRDAQRSEPRDESGGTATGGGGLPGAGLREPSSVGGEAPDADAANLEYARKQTDLVLEKLADQLRRKRVDKGLLDQLGWSEEEFRRFVERWQKLKSAARSNNPSAPEARRELDDALRSLGLRPGSLRQSELKADQFRDLREGYRGPVPLEYQERLRAYNEGISRARQEGE